MRASSSSSRLGLGIGLAVAILVPLCACSPRYEIDRPGTWQPTGANEANLRAMLVDPRDLSGGVGTSTSRGDGGGRAVTRLLTDRRRSLLDVTTSKIGGANGNADAGPALPTTGAGAGAP